MSLRMKRALRPLRGRSARARCAGLGGEECCLKADLQFADCGIYFSRRSLRCDFDIPSRVFQLKSHSNTHETQLPAWAPPECRSPNSRQPTRPDRTRRKQLARPPVKDGQATARITRFSTAVHTARRRTADVDGECVLSVSGISFRLVGFRGSRR
jgi:hypothetical protein